MITEFERKRRWFFALCRELKYDIVVARTKAKVRFNLQSFAEIQEFQLDWLIDRLLHEKDKRL